MNSSDILLHQVKNQKWFYQFRLPDGSLTDSYLDTSFRPIHGTRERMLRSVLDGYRGPKESTLDVACHEGYFSCLLSERFRSVTGIDKNQQSLEKAAQIFSLLSISNVSLKLDSAESYQAAEPFDFVLCFGLLYHHENPVGLIRTLSSLTKHTLCLETQVTPFDMSGGVEDGSFMNLRAINGIMTVCDDYPESAEGGLTDIALIPSRSCLEYLLTRFGFKQVTFEASADGDYEQFRRGQRVVVTAVK